MSIERYGDGFNAEYDRAGIGTALTAAFSVSLEVSNVERFRVDLNRLCGHMETLLLNLKVGEAATT
jgi:hypothetical protein